MKLSATHIRDLVLKELPDLKEPRWEQTKDHFGDFKAERAGKLRCITVYKSQNIYWHMHGWDEHQIASYIVGELGKP